MKPEDPLAPLKKLEKDIDRLKGRGAQPSSSPQMQDFRILMSMGWQFASAVLVGSAMGVVLDRWLGTGPALFLAGLALGTTGGGMAVWRAAGVMENEDGNVTEQDQDTKHE